MGQYCCQEQKRVVKAGKPDVPCGYQYPRIRMGAPTGPPTLNGRGGCTVVPGAQRSPVDDISLVPL